MEKFLKGCPLIFSTRGGLEWDRAYMEGNGSPGFDQDRSRFVPKVNENVNI
jgi:hypothetical protein